MLLPRSVAAVAARPEPQRRLISLEDERIKREAFTTLLPVYTFKTAPRYVGSGEAVEPGGWIDAESGGRIKEAEGAGGWRHTRVVLAPTNRGHPPIILAVLRGM